VTVLDAITGSLPHRRAEAERFAALLDGRRVNGGPEDHPELADLAGLASALAPVEHAPDPSFRLGLRERLVAEAADLPQRPVTAPQGVRPDSRSTGTTGDHRDQPRWRTAAATLTAVALVTGAGAAAASNRALPGDSLYGLKRQIESVELSLARTDLGRGTELLEQAEARLSEAEQLAASSSVTEPETQQQLASTLDDMAAATEDGSTALLDAYRETGDPEPLQVLDRFATRQRERLADLMALLSPELRDRMSPVLDALARLDAQATALLGSATRLTALESARESGDGWAVSRLLATSSGTGSGSDRGTSTGNGPGADLTGTAGDLTSDGGSLADGDSTGTGAVGGLLDDTTDALTGATGSGSSGTAGGAGTTSGGVGAGVDDVTDGATTAAGSVTSAVPLPPAPSAAPLPTTSPLPTLDTSSITSPLPTASGCVTLLGVSTC
jgi:hypothetical protein